jgi:predicted amidophosphoribosyltransferase
LDKEQRRSNVAGAFRANAALATGRSILLADDVMTTGATLSECARVLLEAGAARVAVLVLARD